MLPAQVGNLYYNPDPMLDICFEVGTSAFYCTENKLWKESNDSVVTAPAYPIVSINISYNGYFVLATDSSVFYSSNSGSTWTQTATTPVSSGIKAVAVMYTMIPSTLTYIYVATSNAVYSSSDFGSTWTTLISSISGIIDIDAGPFGNLYIATPSQVYTSSGTSLRYTGETITGLSTGWMGEGPLVVTDSTAYFSTGSSSWSKLTLPADYTGIVACAMDYDDSNFFILSRDNGVILSSNAGSTWTEYSTPNL